MMLGRAVVLDIGYQLGLQVRGRATGRIWDKF